jgi:chemotaxis protein CheZ
MATQLQSAPDQIAASDYQALAREVDMVALYITDLRSAINGLGVLDITDRKLNAVQADINEVILHTRSATDTVLETAESLMAANETGGAYRELVEERMMRLMEACSFQDLTGQRLSRVSETLNAMEERLKRFAALVKPKGHAEIAGSEERHRDDWRQRNLVNGPGGANAMDQEMVDFLLANCA